MTNFKTTLLAATAALISSTVFAAPNQVNLIQAGVGGIAVLSQAANTESNRIDASQEDHQQQLYASQSGGNGNTSSFNQKGFNSYIESHVIGGNNQVNVVQGFTVEGGKSAAHSIATANVTGNDNAVNVSQRGAYLSAYNTVNGSGNSVYNLQVSPLGAYSDNRVNGNNNQVAITQQFQNTAGVIINGSNNSANIAQWKDGGTSDGYHLPNRGYITLAGNNNLTYINQRGLDSEVGINTVGNNNNLNIDSYTYYGKAYIDNNGNNNKVAIKQNANRVAAAVKVDGSDNNAYIEQRYNSSHATITLTGNRNDANITQHAWEADAWIDIVGSDNSADIFQGDTRNVAGITQRGNGHIAGINQVSLNPASTSTTDDIWGYNQAYIHQEGAAKFASINQSGRHNYADIRQP